MNGVVGEVGSHKDVKNKDTKSGLNVEIPVGR